MFGGGGYIYAVPLVGFPLSLGMMLFLAAFWLTGNRWLSLGISALILAVLAFTVTSDVYFISLLGAPVSLGLGLALSFVGGSDPKTGGPAPKARLIAGIVSCVLAVPVAGWMLWETVLSR